MVELHALTAGEVLWGIVGAMFTVGVVHWIISVLVDVERSGGRLKAKDLADDSGIPRGALGFPPHDFSKFPVNKAAGNLDPTKYSVIEVSHDILLSKLAKALATQGICISNTPRGTLRIHDIPNWTPETASDENVLMFPMPKPQAG